jgi:hypothetical protein
VLCPITAYVCETLGENERKTSGTELCYVDLEKLRPDQITDIGNWLIGKVDEFGLKVRPAHIKRRTPGLVMSRKKGIFL